MARAATTADVFNAIAEPRRRQIVELLAERGEQSVGTIVERTGLSQPGVSKHLSVLRKVGLVSASKDRRRRLYRLNAQELKVVHDWTRTFQRFWMHQLGRIKERAERMAGKSGLGTRGGRGGAPGGSDQQPKYQGE
jgi:DNA-binding transcriptional ArsR family regulator